MARWDRRARICWLPSKKPGLAEAAGLSRAQLDAALWAVTPAGRQLRGAGGVLAAFDAAALGDRRIARTVYAIPGLRSAFDAGYALFARHRGRFGGTAACSLRSPAPLDDSSVAELARRRAVARGELHVGEGISDADSADRADLA